MPAHAGAGPPPAGAYIRGMGGPGGWGFLRPPTRGEPNPEPGTLEASGSEPEGIRARGEVTVCGLRIVV